MIYEKLVQKMEQKEVNHEWKNIKSTILESAEEIINTREEHIRNEWWDEECRGHLKEKYCQKEMLTNKNQNKPRTIYTSNKMVK